MNWQEINLGDSSTNLCCLRRKITFSPSDTWQNCYGRVRQTCKHFSKGDNKSHCWNIFCAFTSERAKLRQKKMMAIYSSCHKRNCYSHSHNCPFWRERERERERERPQDIVAVKVLAKGINFLLRQSWFSSSCFWGVVDLETACIEAHRQKIDSTSGRLSTTRVSNVIFCSSSCIQKRKLQPF